MKICGILSILFQSRRQNSYNQVNRYTAGTTCNDINNKSWIQFQF
ncbi:hypothetical protein D1AOALGA4SA_4359 [Olavius algarvensis Delta 1 endosymbiont]|nr:hypothetical protein D1AOALGA4SA_4359 [Olavius algarvensis Delta 1 endosymbiont]